ncbi:MAG: hypothetical protein JWM49_631 [Microbacteriaceae bacterium]|nr:hypothetical protein [Microbacteriaceae bacterium]
MNISETVHFRSGITVKLEAASDTPAGDLQADFTYDPAVSLVTINTHVESFEKALRRVINVWRKSRRMHSPEQIVDALVNELRAPRRTTVLRDYTTTQIERPGFTVNVIQ